MIAKYILSLETHSKLSNKKHLFILNFTEEE